MSSRVPNIMSIPHLRRIRVLAHSGVSPLRSPLHVRKSCGIDRSDQQKGRDDSLGVHGSERVTINVRRYKNGK